MVAPYGHHNTLSSKRISIISNVKLHVQRQLAYSTLPGQLALKVDIVVTVKCHTGTQAVRHLVWEQAVAYCPVDAKSLQLALVVDEAQAVAIAEGFSPSHVERVTAQFLDLAHKLTHGFGRVGREDVGLTAMQEVGGEATVERLLQIGREGISAMAARGPAILGWMLGNNSVQTLAVSSHYVLDIGCVLEPSLNLKGGGTGLNEFLQMGTLVQVFQRQQVALVFQLTAVGIQQVKPHAAHLGTGTTVGRASEAMLGGVTQTAITDAECTVDKNLQFNIGHLAMDGGNLVGRQLARQHYTAEPQRA